MRTCLWEPSVRVHSKVCVQSSWVLVVCDSRWTARWMGACFVSTRFAGPLRDEPASKQVTKTGWERASSPFFLPTRTIGLLKPTHHATIKYVQHTTPHPATIKVLTPYSPPPCSTTIRTWPTRGPSPYFWLTHTSGLLKLLHSPCHP